MKKKKKKKVDNSAFDSTLPNVQVLEITYSQMAMWSIHARCGIICSKILSQGPRERGSFRTRKENQEGLDRVSAMRKGRIEKEPKMSRSRKELQVLREKFVAHLNSIHFDRIGHEVRRLTDSIAYRILSIGLVFKSIYDICVDQGSVNEAIRNVQAVVSDMESKMVNLEADMESKMVNLKADMESKMVNLKADMDSKVVNLVTPIVTRVGKLEHSLKTSKEAASLKKALKEAAALKASEAALKASEAASEAALKASEAALKASEQKVAENRVVKLYRQWCAQHRAAQRTR